MQQCSTQFNDLSLPLTPTDPYPPLPLEIDDEYIFVDHIEPQPPEYLSRITGNNLHTKVYSALMPLSANELSYDTRDLINRNHLKNLLGDCLSSVKEVLSQAPEDFQLKPLTHINLNCDQQDDISILNSGAPNLSCQKQQEELDLRNSIQIGIQKLNLQVSQVLIRSYLVAKYWNLYDLCNITQDKLEGILEPNGIGASTTPIDMILDQKVLKYSNEDDECDDVNEFDNEYDSVASDLLGIIRLLNANNDKIYGKSFVSTFLISCPTSKSTQTKT